MTKQETAARLFEIVRDMTPASAGARRSLAALSARLLRGDELDGIELLNGLMTAGAALDPLDVMSRGELDRLYKDISAAVNAAPAKEAKPARKIDDPIMIRWQTGHIEIYPGEFFPCTPAKLRQLVSYAEIDRAESLDAIRAYLENARAAWTQRKAKKEAARFAALLDVIGPAPVKKTPVIRAAERIIKNASREAYEGAFTSGGKQCVCDGYRLVRFRDPLPLPEAAGGLDVEKSIGPASLYETPLDLPTVKDLRGLIRIAKQNGTAGNVFRVSRKLCLYDFGPDLPTVNAQFLLDMLEALPGCTASFYKIHSPIYFTAENGDGILLPVRKPAESAAA